jgi:hypothetical protein
MTRIRPKPILPTCSAESWHQLLIAMNRKEDEVILPRAILADAQACEEAHAGARGEPIFRFEPSHVGRSKITLPRKQVWDFVQAHRCEGARP